MRKCHRAPTDNQPGSKLSTRKLAQIGFVFLYLQFGILSNRFSGNVVAETYQPAPMPSVRYGSDTVKCKKRYRARHTSVLYQPKHVSVNQIVFAANQCPRQLLQQTDHRQTRTLKAYTLRRSPPSLLFAQLLDALTRDCAGSGRRGGEKLRSNRSQTVINPFHGERIRLAEHVDSDALFDAPPRRSGCF